MIALEISLVLKDLSYILLFLQVCLSKMSAQLVENASRPFSLRICPCTLSSCLNESKKVLL